MARFVLGSHAHRAKLLAKRKIRTNFFFGQKELSQDNKVQTVGLSLQAAGSGVVCFGIVRAIAHEARKISANFLFGQRELLQGDESLRLG